MASQFTSAFAVAADSAIGATMSPPVIAAVVNTVRRFFTFIPFAERAPRHARRRGRGCPFGGGASSHRAVSGRRDSGGIDRGHRASVSRRPCEGDGLCLPAPAFG